MVTNGITRDIAISMVLWHFIPLDSDTAHGSVNCSYRLRRGTGSCGK